MLYQPHKTLLLSSFNDSSEVLQFVEPGASGLYLLQSTPCFICEP